MDCICKDNKQIYNINTVTIQVVKSDQVEKVISALKNWYVINDFGPAEEADLDTIRNIRL
jgi:hypothetical protein